MSLASRDSMFPREWPAGTPSCTMLKLRAAGGLLQARTQLVNREGRAIIAKRRFRLTIQSCSKFPLSLDFKDGLDVGSVTERRRAVEIAALSWIRVAREYASPLFSSKL